MKRVFAAIFLAAMLVNSNVQAEDITMNTLDYDACRVLVEQGEILSMIELMELVKGLSDGRIIDTRLLQLGNVYTYEMEIAGKDGMVTMLYVDARSGALSHHPIAEEQLSQSKGG
ncbi:PepSY domain-containing protein [Amphritea sp. HPY]|uniref:PepSY domain-containing protein n=1 Tax=Amphritea sp. HPY TaxID=3421652 RepID=UPI003D7EFCB9